MPISKTYRRSQTKEKRKMTDYSVNITMLQRMSAGSAEYQKFMAQMGDNTASKIGDTAADNELLFNTMQYYKTMEYADDWSDDAKALSVEDLIKLWKQEDDADKSFAKDFMEFNALMQGYSKPEPDPPTPPTPPTEENFVRPYVPDDDLTDDQKDRMKDFDLMRAHDVSLSGDTENYPDLAGLSAENGDYELLFEYLRQREGTSFLYPSDYNEDGTLKESGQTKEAEMIAKLQELCTADPTKKIGTVLNEFLEEYEVSEPTETQYGTVNSGKLTDMVGESATKNIKKDEPQTITIGENEYLITNIGDDNTTPFKYEVKSETKDGKTHVYIHMEGNNLRIQDVSGKLQGDVIELQGNGNEIDLGMGDDILSIIGENNRALMGDGDDKVYIQGDNNFSDLWRGDDSLFNIDNANAIGIGFTGDDEFYTKGDNVVVNGESPHQGQLAAGELGDGLYQDGVTEKHDIERDLTKPSWFPPTEEPEDPNEPIEHDPSDGPYIDFDGVRYRVYRKIAGKFDPTDTIKYYKDDQNRTVFEANGWYIAVLESLNDTNDKDYSNVVIKGDRNTLIGSKDNDKIDIQGSNNWISADAKDNIHEEGGDDTIKITSGTGNSIYGEYGNDSLEGNLDGNFFNILRTDIETINGQPVTPPADDDDDDTDPADPAGDGTSTTPPTTNNNNLSESVDTVTSPYADTSKWENYSVASTAPTYALTNNGTYNAYTMALLDADSPEDLVPTSTTLPLINYNMWKAEYYDNSEFYECIREASDLVEMLDNMDGDATGTVTAQDILDMYNSCDTGENKDKDYAKAMITLCKDSSKVLEIDSTTGLARIKSTFSNLDKIDIKNLFKIAYDMMFLNYHPKLAGEVFGEL